MTLATTLFDGALAYLATPYTRAPGGLHEAWIDACRLVAQLIREGVMAYSPIAHTHPVAIYGDLDPKDHSIWLPYDALMMAKADCLIVAHLPGWESSKGIAHEIGVFKAAGKPIYDLNPDDMTFARRK